MSEEIQPQWWIEGTLNDDDDDDVQRHEGVKPYACSECPKRFCTAQELKRHQLVHSDVRNFACGFCAKSFKRKRDVMRHFKRLACDQRFSDI